MKKCYLFLILSLPFVGVNNIGRYFKILLKSHKFKKGSNMTTPVQPSGPAWPSAEASPAHAPQEHGYHGSAEASPAHAPQEHGYHGSAEASFTQPTPALRRHWDFRPPIGIDLREQALGELVAQPGEVELNFSGISDISVEEINRRLEAGGANVVSVDFSRCKLPTPPRLSLCPNIRRLNLSGVETCAPTDWAPEVSRLINLVSVDYSDSNLSGIMFKSNRLLGSLKVFRAARTSTSDNIVRLLSEISRNLIDLDLEGCQNITDYATHFFNQIPSLININLKGCKKITHESIELIRHIKYFRPNTNINLFESGINTLMKRV